MPTASEIYGQSGDVKHDPTLLQKLDLVPALFSVRMSTDTTKEAHAD